MATAGVPATTGYKPNQLKTSSNQFIKLSSPIKRKKPKTSHLVLEVQLKKVL